MGISGSVLNIFLTLFHSAGYSDNVLSVFVKSSVVSWTRSEYSMEELQWQVAKVVRLHVPEHVGMGTNVITSVRGSIKSPNCYIKSFMPS